jgi:hypothetical protein
MTTEEFNTYWQKHYPECPPIAYYLKDVYKDRWFRIHTLPDSKRYPEFEEEYKEILKRHNLILSDLFGDDGHFVLITAGYSDTPQPVRPENEIARLMEGNRKFLTVGLHELEGDNDPRYTHLYMNELVWESHSLDDLLRMIANDEIANVMIVGVKRGFVYHPYDGGADIILESGAERDRMRRKYSAWLSKHPEGL